MRKPYYRSLTAFLPFLTIAIFGQGCPPANTPPPTLTVTVNPAQPTISSTENSVDLNVTVDGAQASDTFRYVWQVPADALGAIKDQTDPVPPLGTKNAHVQYVLNNHTAEQTVKLETLTLTVYYVNADDSNGAVAGSVHTEVTVFPGFCDGSGGTPVFNGCGTSTTSSSTVRMGEQMTITFKQQSGGICGGDWTIDMNMPGHFISADGGTIGTQSATFPNPDSTTTRTAVFQLSAQGFDYAGKRICPRALGYYEPPTDDTGPYISVSNGAAHDYVPYVVTP